MSGLRKPFVASFLGLAWVAGCGSADPARQSTGEPVASGASAIQGGTTDTTHNFAVGVVEMNGQNVAFCSGVLLAPNLVATARHCVSKLQSAEIDCMTSTFVDTLPATDIFVTPDSTISHSGVFVSVASITVPPDSSVCGNDIALLILSKAIEVPQYVTPAINPPMTDHQVYATAVTAIGYGVDSPADTNGSTAGVRRIKENVNLVCIPNDMTFPNCLADSTWLQFATVKEFEGGDGTCDGDSGSGAYDQGSFNKGDWVAFGVLSRGGVSDEGGTCTGSIYSRFDAWSKLVIDTANEAATMGGYAPPSWTGVTSQPASAAGPSGAGRAPACLPNTTACSQDSDCCSVNCISHDNNVTSFCAACDPNDPCNTDFGCQAGVCVMGAMSIVPPVVEADSGSGGPATSKNGGGCALGQLEPEDRPPWHWGVTTIGIAALAVGRRKQRRKAPYSGPAVGFATLLPAPRNPRPRRSIIDRAALPKSDGQLARARGICSNLADELDDAECEPARASGARSLRGLAPPRL